MTIEARIMLILICHHFHLVQASILPEICLMCIVIFVYTTRSIPEQHHKNSLNQQKTFACFSHDYSFLFFSHVYQRNSYHCFSTCATNNQFVIRSERQNKELSEQQWNRKKNCRKYRNVTLSSRYALEIHVSDTCRLIASKEIQFSI